MTIVREAGNQWIAEQTVYISRQRGAELLDEYTTTSERMKHGLLFGKTVNGHPWNPRERNDIPAEFLELIEGSCELTVSDGWWVNNTYLDKFNPIPTYDERVSGEIPWPKNHTTEL